MKQQMFASIVFLTAGCGFGATHCAWAGAVIDLTSGGSIWRKAHGG